MPTSTDRLPRISAPSIRTTRSGTQWTQFVTGDLQQLQEQVPLWVRGKAKEQIEIQIQLGNSKQYSTVVDGVRDRAVEVASRRAQVFFVGAILARNLEKARRVLEAAIRKTMTTHTGLLASGWDWYHQKAGSRPTMLGGSVPADLQLRSGDALILVPRAKYAWFANYNASRLESFIPREVKRSRRIIAGGGKPVRRRRPPRGSGFMAYAARQIRPELRRIGVTVWPRFMSDLAPTGTRSRQGVPVLVLAVSKKLMQQANRL